LLHYLYFWLFFIFYFWLLVLLLYFSFYIKVSPFMTGNGRGFYVWIKIA